MARVPYLDAADLDPGYRSLLDRPINLFRALANDPDGLREFHRIGEWIRYGGQLEPRLRELAILRVGYLTGNEYEYSHHIRIAQEFGVTPHDLNLVCRTAQSPVPDGPAAAVLDAATEITQRLSPSDATWRRMVEALGVAGAVELVLVVAHYNAVVRVLDSLRVDVEPDYLRHLDEYPMSTKD